MLDCDGAAAADQGELGDSYGLGSRRLQVADESADFNFAMATTRRLIAALASVTRGDTRG